MKTPSCATRSLGRLRWMPVRSRAGWTSPPTTMSSQLRSIPNGASAMAGRYHVLLIGIDAYDGGGMLTGCVNDIDAVQRLLVDNVGVPRTQIRRLAAPR